ncbi:hypothetical protein [Oceanisphaera pacifica]|uniref:Uncharacterized protein n=1 Tax=Oceanisphaera pacifica TaxID=2818389 RepID=A0ABS3NGM5_9GAMM|nr:hypothetical protein [Oceanisphaera pacifica]MBO1519748.1 hypothetical protein [Oceanisphaera pacifica]
MIRYGLDNPPLLALYYLFISFIVASIFGEGNAAFYVGSLSFMLVVLVLIMYQAGSRQMVNLHFLFLCLVLVPLLFCGPFEQYSLYMRFLALEFLLLFFLFTEFRISLEAFSRCLNLSYLLFLILSSLDWLGLVSLVPDDTKNSFFISVGSYTIETLYGLGGSTADIDSYSGLLLLWNLFINRGGRFRLVMIGLSAVAMILTFRFTPMVALLAACLSYLFVWNRFLAILALLLAMSGFIIVLVILQINPVAQVPFMPDTDWYSLLWKATNARSSIWLRQIHYYLTEFQLSSLFYGPLDERMTVDFIDGNGRYHMSNYNPHNTYLAMLFRSTVIFSIFYALYLWGTLRKARRNTFPLLFFISIAAYTNTHIIGLQNPVYLLVIMYILIAVPQGQFSDGYFILPKKRVYAAGF